MPTAEFFGIAATFLLAVMGIWVSIWPPNKHKTLWLCAFIATGLFGVFEAWLIGAENKQQAAEERSDDAFRIALLERKLTRTLGDIGRVQQLNTDLQKQLLESNSTIVNLAKEGRDQITGGESFCYVEVRYVGGDLLGAFVLGKGNNAVSDVQIRIVDLDPLDKALPSGQPRHDERSFSFPHAIRYTGLLKPLYFVKVTPGTMYKRFNVFISSRNGTVTGLLRLRRAEDGGWRLANRVMASFYDKRKPVILEEIDQGFPLEILRSDADWIATDKPPKRR